MNSTLADDAKALSSACEALLIVSDEPVSARDLADVIGVAESEVRQTLDDLSSEYARDSRGFQLRETAGGWRLYTHPDHHALIERYVRSWDARRLSAAALETLAVIAYQQPATRDGVRAIRGVSSDGVIASLVEKGLVRELGKREGNGPILYGTTRLFLEHYGLRSLDDLPALEEFAPDEETRQLIRERLSGARAQRPLEGFDEDEDTPYDAYLEPQDKPEI